MSGAGPPSGPDGVAEALQRLIENGAVLGPASSEDALLVARYRQRLLACAPSAPDISDDMIEAIESRAEQSYRRHHSGIRGQQITPADALSWHIIRATRSVLVEAMEASRARPMAQTRAVRDVIAERRRQVEVEGWAPEHDDKHSTGEMALAASCYAEEGPQPYGAGWATIPTRWPWSTDWWKPQGYRRNLVKAGALILAEIERLDRAAAQKTEGV